MIQQVIVLSLLHFHLLQLVLLMKLLIEYILVSQYHRIPYRNSFLFVCERSWLFLPVSASYGG